MAALRGIYRLRAILSVTAVCGAMIFVPATSYCGEDNRNGNTVVPDGMEVIKEGGVNILVPKGSRPVSAGSYLVTEDPEQYAARKFMDVEDRFSRVDKEIGALQEELKYIKEAVDSMKKEKTPAADPLANTKSS